jgi:CarboxypepD_reg-like domain/TonB-dependent Receptor Plug Domain
MIRTFIFFIILLPFAALAQVTITGKVINNADKKPVANASVFLSNASAGAKTADNGNFILRDAKPGKYDLVVSIIGFETYHQTILVNENVVLPDIEISPRAIALQEVKIKSKADPNWKQHYEWFEDEFLGTSNLANECKILNPGILYLDYDEATNKLTASSNDFLIIENRALGYRINYLLASFISYRNTRALHFEGSVLFEKLNGTPSQEREWQRARQEAYEGSQMHFLRSLLSNRIEEEGFRILQYAIYQNPQRPSDGLIQEKIKLFKKLKEKNSSYSDSLSFWVKKSKLPDTLRDLMQFPLNNADIIKPTDQQGIYALGCDKDALHITYNPDRHFPKKGRLVNLDNIYNKDVTIYNFNSPYVFFDNNGWVLDPGSFSLIGAWGKNRVAELLPLDYEPIDIKKLGNDNSQAINNVFNKLNNFSTDHITEKAYLHFDKPYYAAGDTIYFKAYVTLGEKHGLSNLSGVLHVDLISINNKIDQSIKLQLNNGIAWGDFTLPDNLPKGNYRIRAYTRWMLNDKEAGYFDQVIPVGSLKSSAKESVTNHPKSLNNKAEIQFFPEGGNMVVGIRSKVAFKAIDTTGLGINVKGIIIDNTNKEVASFAPVHAGMGYFYINPEEGKTYRAKITYPDGKQDVADLPVADTKGITLSINNDASGKAFIKLEANKTWYQENKNKECNVVIYSGGVTSIVPFKADSNSVTLDISKSNLHTGIAKVTLFSPLAIPLCERLFFVQNYDQLNLVINTDKAQYSKREKVNIMLNAKENADKPAHGHFSVSVTDESKVPVDEDNQSTILTSLLLTSDLKGYVEQPNYYFRYITDKTQGDLDLVMLTNGYRRFEWKKLLNELSPPITYQPEKGIEISGMVKNSFGNPLANGKVSLISFRGAPVVTESTDDKGNFTFTDPGFTDSAKFMLQAVNAYGKNSTTIKYKKETNGVPAIEKTKEYYENLDQPKSVYLENIEKQHEEAVTYGTASEIMLKEVKIKEKKKSESDYPSSNLTGPGHADQVIHHSEFRGGGSFSDQFNGLLRGVLFVPSMGGKKNAVLSGGSGMGMNGMTPMLLVLDGSPMQGMSVDDINVNTIETIEVLKGVNASIYGMSGGAGVLVITSRQGGMDPKDILATGVLPITVDGFYRAREFYYPKYDHVADNLNHPDLRSTIYWKPELVTDKDGNASFDYYNADNTGNYRVVIEGIDEKGNIGRQVYKYRVGPAVNSQSNSLQARLLNLKAASDSTNKKYAPEKLYMQFDKPYYAVSDTMWFKAWLINAPTYLLSAKSSFLHVDIATDSNKVVKQYLLPVQAGVSWGNITLDQKEFKPGNYVIRAYTNWMRNFGDDYFYEKRIQVVSANENGWLVSTLVNTSNANNKQTVDAKFRFTGIDKIPVANKLLQLNVMSGTKNLYKQKAQTDQNGLLEVNFMLPQKTTAVSIVAENVTKDSRAIIPVNLADPENIDLQFLPEGGNLTAGINAHIGFKAIGQNGKGVDLSGIITDQNQQQVANFKSLHNGIGSFDLAVIKGETYAAKVTLPDGSVKIYPLPALKASGTVLQINNKLESDSVRVIFSATDDLVQLHDSYYLIGKARGVICYAAIVSFNNGSNVTRSIAKNLFPSGITHFILTSSNGQPLNERLVFIDHHDNLHVDIEPDEYTYEPKDSIAVHLRVRDNLGNPVTANFSLAVTDDAQLKTDTLNNDNILTRMMLTSDLKGYVEGPGYYFQKNTGAAQALDNLLLTQGWISYEPDQSKQQYDAETEYAVKGRVINVFSKPVKASKVTLFSKSPFIAVDTLTDNEGRFVFHHIPRADTPVFILNALNKSGKSFNVSINMDEVPAPVFNAPKAPVLMPWYVNSDSTLMNYVKDNITHKKQLDYGPEGNHVLKEVVINAKKIIKGSYNLNGPGEADIVLDEKALEHSGKKTFRQLFEQNIPGFRVVFPPVGPALFYIYSKRIYLMLDGVMADQIYNGFDIKPYSEFNGAEDIKGMEVMSSAKYAANYMSRFFPLSPITEFAFIEITTRSGNPIITNTPGTYLYKPLAVSWPAQFYKPKYKMTDTVKRMADLRSTIDWEPNIITDANGKATVSFYAAGRPSTYTIITEGMDFNGNLGFKSQKINISKKRPKAK